MPASGSYIIYATVHPAFIKDVRLSVFLFFFLQQGPQPLTQAAFLSNDADHEALLSRSTQKDRAGRPRRDVQVLSRSPLWRKPLLCQALPQLRQAGSVAGAQKGRRKTAEGSDETVEKPLEEDAEKRPAATVSKRRRFLESTTGKALSDSTVKRLLKRFGFSRKREPWGRWSETRMAKGRLEGDNRPKDHP